MESTTPDESLFFSVCLLVYCSDLALSLTLASAVAHR